MLTVPPWIGPAGNFFGVGGFTVLFNGLFSPSFLLTVSSGDSDFKLPSELVGGVGKDGVLSLFCSWSVIDENLSVWASLESVTVDDETGLSSTEFGLLMFRSEGMTLLSGCLLKLLG